MLRCGRVRGRGNQNVARRQASVHEATAPSRRIECFGQLRDDQKRTLGLETPLAREQTREVDALDMADGDVEAPLGLSDLVDRDDVRVVERGDEPRLAQEPLPEPLVGGELGIQELEHDPPVQAHVLREEHHASAASAEHGLQPVPGEQGSDSRIAAHLHARVLVASRGWARAARRHRRRTPGRASIGASPVPSTPMTWMSGSPSSSLQ